MYGARRAALHTVPPACYRVTSQVAAVRVDHLKRHVVANVGLLMATLFSGEDEVVQVSMVTQVTPGDEGVLIRDIYNPLE